MKAEVIVVTYGNPELTKRCFQSLREHTNDYRLIWVDNGSGPAFVDEVYPYASACDEFVPLYLGTNMGFIKGNNAALRYLIEIVDTDADIVVLMNNDVEVTAGWLDRMRAVLKRDSNVHAVGPVASECASWQSFLNASKVVPVFQTPIGFERLDTRLRAEKLDYHYGELAGKCKMLAFFCTAIRTNVFRRLGYLDEIFKEGYGDDDDYCYDEQTQVVTRDGVKFIMDVTMMDEILTMGDDDIMNWERPTRLVSREEDELLHFKTRRLDIMVSKDQDLLVGYSYPSKGIEKPLSFMSASEVNDRLWPKQGRYYVKKNGGIWNGEDRPETVIGGVSFPTMPLVEFLGWYLSEGHCEKRCGAMMITQWKDDFKPNIRKTLESLGLNFTETEQGFYIKAGSGLYEFCLGFGGSSEKRVPELVKSLTPRYIRAFLLAYRMGDGSKKVAVEGDSYATSSDCMKDDLIELLLKVGRTFSIRRRDGGRQTFSNGEYDCKPVWQIQSYRKNERRALLQPAKIVKYRGKTYDLTVPSRRIYVIRNGKGCWSSNCKRMREAKMNLALSMGTYVVHEHGATFKRVYSPDALKMLRRERLEAYEEKHGETPKV
jgi:hypothetical protein